MQENVVQFSVSKTLHASNQAVWAVLGDFGTEHRWTRTLKYCERNTASVSVGTTRTCVLPKPLMGRTRVHETLIEYAPHETLMYELDGAAGPFRKARSRWSSLALSPDTTELKVEGVFVPRDWFSRYAVWPAAKPMLQRLTRQVLGEFEAYVIGASLKSPI